MGIGKGMRWWSLAAVVLLMLAGCDGGIQVPPVSDGTGGEAAGLAFTLTSFARTGTGTSGTAATRLSAPAGSQRSTLQVNGQLLVESLDGRGEENYTWALLVDETAFQISTSVSLNLDPGRYHFYFLMEAGGRYYAGVTENHLIVGTEAGGSSSNLVPFTLNPVLTDDPIDVRTIQQLAQFRFQYNSDDIKNYDDPSFSIKVDDGEANVFNINPNSVAPFVYILLPQGTYHFVLKFYDGATLKLVAEDDVEIGSGGGTTEIDVQPLVTEVSYTYVPGATADQDSGNLHVLVPGTIVAEAGGLDALLVSAAVVGPLTALVEQDLTLTVDPNSSQSYSANMDVPGLTAGPLTWSIQFRRTQGGALFAYCALTIEIPQPTSAEPVSGSFFCAPQLIVQNVTATTPVSPLSVEVTDPDGPVPGAVVHSNSDPLGITSGGAVVGSTSGKLDSFLPTGVYGIKAEQDAPDPVTPGNIITRTAEKLVSLLNGEPVSTSLQFEALYTPPPPPPPSDDDGDQPGEDGDDGTQAEDFIELTAMRRSSPLRFFDERVHLAGWAKIRIPAAEDIQVVQGDPQQYLVVLSFGRRDLRCWYLGGDWDAQVAGWLDDLVQNAFSNPVCTRGKTGGDAVWVHGPVRMRVVGGSRQFRETEVLLRLPVLEVSGQRPGHEVRERPSHWQGRGHWHWWGWWRDQGHDGGHDDDRGRGNDRR